MRKTKVVGMLFAWVTVIDLAELLLIRWVLVSSLRGKLSILEGPNTWSRVTRSNPSKQVEAINSGGQTWQLKVMKEVQGGTGGKLSAVKCSRVG